MARKTDSQNVTNALMSKTLSDLQTSISTLSEETRVGFKGVHERQDIANSKTATNTMDILRLKERFRLGNALWFTITILVGLVVYMMK